MEPGKIEESGVQGQFTHSMTEIHSIAPGLFALFGFQMIVVFNDVFSKQLGSGEKALSVAALVLVAMGAVLLITPAAYHRQARATSVSEAFTKSVSKLATSALVPLMLVMGIDVYLVSKVATGSVGLSLVPAVAVFSACLIFWFVFPQRMRIKMGAKGQSGNLPWPSRSDARPRG